MWDWVQANFDLKAAAIFALAVGAFLAVTLWAGVKWQKWSLRDSIALLGTGFFLALAGVGIMAALDSIGLERWGEGLDRQGDFRCTGDLLCVAWEQVRAQAKAPFGSSRSRIPYPKEIWVTRRFSSPGA